MCPQALGANESPPWPNSTPILGDTFIKERTFGNKINGLENRLFAWGSYQNLGAARETQEKPGRK